MYPYDNANSGIAMKIRVGLPLPALPDIRNRGLSPAIHSIKGLRYCSKICRANRIVSNCYSACPIWAADRSALAMHHSRQMSRA